MLTPQQLSDMHRRVAQTCVDLYASGDEEMMEYYVKMVDEVVSKMQGVLDAKYEAIAASLNEDEDDE